MTGPKPYASKVAIPLPSDADIGKVLGDAYNPGTTLNVIKMVAGTGDMCAATIGMVKAIFSAEGIDPKLRQVVILRAATVLNVPYEWQANVPMSLNNGLTQDEIDRIGTADPVAGLRASYMLLCTATDEMCRDGTLTDATLQALLDCHGDVLTRKIVLIIAWFSLLSLFLNGCRVPMETTDKIGAKTSPLG